MVRFGIPNYQVFLSWNPAAWLVIDVSVTAISCVVASVAKILDKF
jgi:hypothetical protein